MTLLQGYFAMILVVSTGSMSRDDLENILTTGTELEGLTVSFSHEISDSSDGATMAHGVAKYIFHLAVSDTPGIVARISEVLATYGANIVDCATRKNNDSGLFTMVLDVDLPLHDEDKIVEALSRAAADFSGDVIFQRVDDVDL